jgi:hypothetical protein
MEDKMVDKSNGKKKKLVYFSTAMGYGLDSPRISGMIPGKAKRFLCSP